MTRGAAIHTSVFSGPLGAGTLEQPGQAGDVGSDAAHLVDREHVAASAVWTIVANTRRRRADRWHPRPASPPVVPATDHGGGSGAHQCTSAWLQGLQDVEDDNQDKRPDQCVNDQQFEAARTFPDQRVEGATDEPAGRSQGDFFNQPFARDRADDDAQQEAEDAETAGAGEGLAAQSSVPGGRIIRATNALTSCGGVSWAVVNPSGLAGPLASWPARLCGGR